VTLRDRSTIPERRPIGLRIETRPADFLPTGGGAVGTGWTWLQVIDGNGTIIHSGIVLEDEVAGEVAVAVKRFCSWERDLIAAALADR